MKTYIIHLSTDQVRERHIREQLRQAVCLKDHLFINQGDKESITDGILQKFFGGELVPLSAGTSCAYKHLLAYFEILKNQDSFALILEDDIFLQKDFCEKLRQVVDEIKARELENLIVSLEDSSLQYVKNSELVKNQLLYSQKKGRMAGAYLLDNMAAGSFVRELLMNKCTLPIDWFHNHCAEKGMIDIYWLHPPIATQGSLQGSLSSTIDAKKSGTLRVWGFAIQKIYKKLLYKFR